MKKLLLLVFLCFPFALVAQNTGVGTSNPLEFFSVGASSQFRVNASGNIVRINDVAYSFPASQATTGSVLANDGSGNLTWTKVTAGNISATGTPSSSTYLRGDGAWASAGGGATYFSQSFNNTLITSETPLVSNYVITDTGNYIIVVQGTLGTNYGCGLRLYVNGVLISNFGYAGASSDLGRQLTAIIQLTAGDVLDLYGLVVTSTSTFTGSMRLLKL